LSGWSDSAAASSFPLSAAWIGPVPAKEAVSLAHRPQVVLFQILADVALGGERHERRRLEHAASEALHPTPFREGHNRVHQFIATHTGLDDGGNDDDRRVRGVNDLGRVFNLGPLEPFDNRSPSVPRRRRSAGPVEASDEAEPAHDEVGGIVELGTDVADGLDHVLVGRRVVELGPGDRIEVLEEAPRKQKGRGG
jgi:hypothetical protein